MILLKVDPLPEELQEYSYFHDLCPKDQKDFYPEIRSSISLSSVGWISDREEKTFKNSLDNKYGKVTVEERLSNRPGH